MEKSTKKSLSRKYLKILGIISVVIGAITAILGIILFFTLKDVDMMTIFSSEQIAVINDMDIATEAIYIFIGTTVIIFGFLSLLEGWLLLRAAKDPRKSTFLLVLLVLAVATAVVNLITGKIQNSGSIVGSIGSLTIDVLSLIAVLNARREINR